MLLALKDLEGNLSMVRRQLTELAREEGAREVIRCLQSVPGVGPVVATSFCFELFRPERFQRPEEVAGCLGLAPLVRQSGEGKGRGRIDQVGQARLKSLLVEAAWVWKSKDPRAGQFFGRLVARSGIAQKAITALARKLAIILWGICLEKRPYYAKAAILYQPNSCKLGRGNPWVAGATAKKWRLQPGTESGSWRIWRE